MDFRLAAKAFIVSDNKLLVLKREPKNIQMPEAWELPGGRLELGENPFEGLKREVLEECGIGVDVVMPLSIRHFTRKDNQTITMIVFLCKPLSKLVKLSKEHTDFDWISLSEENPKKLTDFFFEEVEAFKNLKKLDF